MYDVRERETFQKFIDNFNEFKISTDRTQLDAQRNFHQTLNSQSILIPWKMSNSTLRNLLSTYTSVENRLIIIHAHFAQSFSRLRVSKNLIAGCILCVVDKVQRDHRPITTCFQIRTNTRKSKSLTLISIIFRSLLFD